MIAIRMGWEMALSLLAADSNFNMSISIVRIPEVFTKIGLIVSGKQTINYIYCSFSYFLPVLNKG
ncbi:MAG: hypothetical protein COZ08_02115 [Bacteroidetes bacterium CG_4_10_14_3_um_filter_42_6]|nr:MAG: hypothetical protein COZ08_02115 [Bacteroidetes bacterium CG_4_10_14_3_um_filter_42_6]